LKVVCPCGQGCEDSHDSRSFGAAFCPTCGDEMCDEDAFNGVACCTDLEPINENPDLENPELFKVVFSYNPSAFTEKQGDAMDGLFWGLCDDLPSIEDGGAGSGFGCRDMDAIFSDYDDAEKLTDRLGHLRDLLGLDEDSLNFEFYIWEMNDEEE